MVKPQLYFHNNVVNTLTLLDAMLAAKPRHISFLELRHYGTPARVPITEIRRRIRQSYGESKLICERAIHWYGEPMHDYAALRYFNASGADPEGEMARRTIRDASLPLVLATALGRGADRYLGRYIRRPTAARCATISTPGLPRRMSRRSPLLGGGQPGVISARRGTGARGHRSGAHTGRRMRRKCRAGPRSAGSGRRCRRGPRSCSAGGAALRSR